LYCSISTRTVGFLMNWPSASAALTRSWKARSVIPAAVIRLIRFIWIIPSASTRNDPFKVSSSNTVIFSWSCLPIT